ncbi:MAG: hypothetical protein C4308_01220 [Chitinophagaceae bacterium]
MRKDYVMRDPDIEPGISWTIVFFVTGISFLSFCCALKFLNNEYPPAFLWIGLGTVALGCISFAISRLLRNEEQADS